VALWQFQLRPKPGCPDPVGRRVLETLRDFGCASISHVRAARLFTLDLESNDPAIARRIADDLLTDPVVETCLIRTPDDVPTEPADALRVEVWFKPGVMDSVAQSTALAVADMDIALRSVQTARAYELRPIPSDADRARAARLLGNDCIEDVRFGVQPISPVPAPPAYTFERVTVPLRGLDDAGLQRLSREGHLFLSLDEMRAIQAHFRQLERDPTDLELETLAQTWSEHCVHKTLKSAVRYRGAPFPNEPTNAAQIERNYHNLLKDTIVRATREVTSAGQGPACLSVFVDNAGVIAFDDDYGIAFKVETHNHPSAIEPYGGAATGVGGCIRDVLGCGLGARPIANTDVFCVAPPDWPVDRVPRGVIHPKTVLKGIVSGVRDYGNRMGIPTVNGAIEFDPRYLGNPLVFCGCVGLIPRDRLEKAARPGDAIVVLGGRTGRDGIHGATFSSAELSDTHEDEFAHAVQIGNPVEEKKILDILLRARDYPTSGAGAVQHWPEPRHQTICLYSAVTDCGAGGLSSAIGEMGEHTGCEVDIERVPLKYRGLKYDEIWISESQERMVLAVPQAHVPTLLALAESEGVEATVIGRFTETRQLVVRYEGTEVGRLDMAFLHDGLPRRTLDATWTPPSIRNATAAPDADRVAELKRRLGHPTVASKHWVVRQYDHEVQGGSVVKPLVGPGEGPSDAAVIRPRLDSDRGVAIGCGLAPGVADRDPYWMAVAAIDEAVRNVVCVGGDPRQTAILDNFCWPWVDDARHLGALVRTCQACYDAATTYGLPFISGKDSLNNEFSLHADDAAMLTSLIRKRYGDLPQHVTHRLAEGRLAIPYTLLISAVALVADVNRCVRSAPRVETDVGGGVLYYVGAVATDWQNVNLAPLARLHHAVSNQIARGNVIAAHDCGDGGLAVAVAEMAIAGLLDATMRMPADDMWADPFVRPVSGYVVQFRDASATSDLTAIDGVVVEPIATLQRTDAQPMFRLGDGDQAEALEALRRAWREPLDW